MKNFCAGYNIEPLAKVVRTCLWAIILVAFFGKLANAQSGTDTQTESAPVHSTLAGRYEKQTGQTPAQNAPMTVSLPHLYWHLLEYQNHLDLVADKLEKQGKDGTALRRTIQTKADFSDGEFAPVRESASHLKAALDDINARAMAIVKADHEHYVKGMYSKDNPPPGVPQLKALTQEREQTITAEITRLNDALGPENAAKLQAYIEQHFSTQVTTSKLPSGIRAPTATVSKAPERNGQNGVEAKP
jgi:hypothetical protein